MAISELWRRFRGRRPARMPGWPDAAGFAGRGARLAAALEGLEPGASPIQLAAVMGAQFGMDALDAAQPLQTSGRLCETAALVEPLAEGMLSALQNQLYAEWEERGGRTGARRRGVDWQLVRSWSASGWRLHDRRDALRSYVDGGFLPALRELRAGRGKTGPRRQHGRPGRARFTQT
jgi:hypothetical protein